MKDNILLILAAIIITALSWAFFHVLGERALDVMVLFVMASLLADNYRMRKRLRGRDVSASKNKKELRE